MADNPRKDAERIGRVESGASKAKTDEIRQLHQKIVSEIQKPSRAEETAEQVKMDQFRSGNFLPKFMQSVQKKMDGSFIYQTFKLPGTNVIVRDQRGVSNDSLLAEQQSQVLKDGKMIEAQKRSYVNFLAARMPVQAEVKLAEKEISRLLSEFEKLLIERFEANKEVAKESEDGKLHYKEKSEEEWQSFFGKFTKRTAKKDGKLDEVEEFIYRGSTAKRLIGDMKMKDGETQKFARLKFLSELVHLLKTVEPGSVLEMELLQKLLGGREFKYLVLASKHQEKFMNIGMETSKGLFGQLKYEEEIARQLGIKSRKKDGKYSGPIRWSGKDRGSEDAEFVPLGIGERGVRSHSLWRHPALYIVIAIIVLIFILIAIF